MDLKNAIISATVTDGVSKKNGKPYTAVVVLLKANDAVITKRFFIQDYEKPLLSIA